MTKPSVRTSSGKILAIASISFLFCLSICLTMAGMSWAALADETNSFNAGQIETSALLINPTPTKPIFYLRPTSTPWVIQRPSSTPTPTPTETPSEREYLGECYVYFSVEEPNSLSAGTHGDILMQVPGGSPQLLPGGSNAELMSAFWDLDEMKEFPNVGLDGFDILAFDKRFIELNIIPQFPKIFPQHKIVFTVEDRFKVYNPKHPLAGQILTGGELLLTNGGVIMNQVLIAPLQLINDKKEYVKFLGIDAVEVQGFNKLFDALEGKVIEDIEQLYALVEENMFDVSIIFSFEEINEEYIAGSGSLLPTDTLVSADDLIELRITPNGPYARVFRSGADRIPSTATSILEGFFSRVKLPENKGLDAVSVCYPEEKSLPEDIDVFFSTELDNDADANAFTHGDLLLHNIAAHANRIVLSFNELTKTRSQMGLDGLDLFPEQLRQVVEPTDTPEITPTEVPPTPTVYIPPDLGWVPFVDDAKEGEIPLSIMKEETTMGTLINFNIYGMYAHEVEMEGVMFHRLRIPGYENSNDIGDPELPILGQVIEIPYGVDVSVEIYKREGKILQNYNVIPAQKPDLEQDNKDDDENKIEDRVFTINEKIYSTPRFYPGNLAEAENDDAVILRGHRLLFLKVNPLQYNPVTKELQVYSQIETRIVFNRPGQVKRIDSRIESPAYENILRASVLNYKDLSRFPIIGASLADLLEEMRSGCDYLILTHGDFYDPKDPNTPLAKLKEWKQQKGLITKIQNVANIAGSGTAADIQAYLQNAYDNWTIAPTYVLLVGDCNFIPPCYGTAHGSHDNTPVGTDLYYGTVDGSDPFPDIMIGRMSVDTIEQCETIVEKILNYEKEPPGNADYYTDTSLVRLFEDDDPSNGREDSSWILIELAEEMRDFLLANGYNAERIYNRSGAYVDGPLWYENGSDLPDYLTIAGNPPAVPGFPWNGGAGDITDAINNGNFLVTYRGHGGRQGWGRPGFHTWDFGSLANGRLTPVIFGLTCQTGWFDNETDDPGLGTNDDCFAEEILRLNGGGAVAIIASARNSWGRTNNSATKGLCDALWPTFDPAIASGPLYKMGQINTYTKVYMGHYLTADTGRLISFEMNNLFGDPDLPVWTRQPDRMTVTHPIGIGSTGWQSFIVKVLDRSTGQGLNNATVVLTRGNAILARNQTNPGGIARFDLDGPGSGNITVTVTLHNYEPYQGIMEAGSGGAILNRLDPNNGTEGSAAYVGGVMFDGNENVDIYFDGTLVRTVAAQSGAFGQSGMADISINIPSPHDLGPVNVAAHGRNSNRYAVDVFTVRTENPIDLYIYDQWDDTTWHLHPGDNPTWNNPDIILYNSSGDPVESNNLVAGQNYFIRATIHNDTNFIAENVKVSFKWANFGVGQPDRVWEPIDTDFLDVPAHDSAEAEVEWAPPSTGHLCIMAEIYHVEDINEDNNFGQENCHVGPTSSPAKIPFTVWNSTDKPASLYFELRQINTQGKDYAERLWGTFIQQPDPQILEPDEEREIEVIIEPDYADVKRGTKAEFALTGFINGKVCGGANFIIFKDFVVPTEVPEPTPTKTPYIEFPERTILIPTITIPHFDNLVVAAGFGGQSAINIRNFDPEFGSSTKILTSFRGLPAAFASRVGGGQKRAMYVSTGDLNNDCSPEIVLSYGPVEGEAVYPNLVIPRNAVTKLVLGNSFEAFPSGTGSPVNYNGGEVRTAVGDFIGSGRNQIAAAQGRGGHGIIRLFQYTGEPAPNGYEIVGQFNGLPSNLIIQNVSPTYNIGLVLAAADLDNDEKDELIVAQSFGPKSQTIFHVLDIAPDGTVEARHAFAGFYPIFRGNGGLEIAPADLNGDGWKEIIVASKGNPQNFGDARDTAPLNLIGVIVPIVEDGMIIGFTRPTGGVLNVLTPEVNPSGALSIAAGEFDGDPSNGDEVIVGTGSPVEGDELIPFKPAPESRYRFIKLPYEGGRIGKLTNWLGGRDGLSPFLGNENPDSGAIFLAPLLKLCPLIFPTPVPDGREWYNIIEIGAKEPLNQGGTFVFSLIPKVRSCAPVNCRELAFMSVEVSCEQCVDNRLLASSIQCIIDQIINGINTFGARTWSATQVGRTKILITGPKAFDKCIYEYSRVLGGLGLPLTLDCPVNNVCNGIDGDGRKRHASGYSFTVVDETGMVAEPTATPIPTPYPDPIWVDQANDTGVEDGSAAFPFDTIAEAMIVATSHTIRVRSGVYVENVSLKDGVKLAGAGADTTIIDGGNTGDGVNCVGVGDDSLIAGFTIQNASVGIYCFNSSPMIRENIITNIDPTATSGDGIRLQDSSPLIQNNVIYGVGGHGISASGDSEPDIINNTIYDYRYYAGISFAALDIGAVSPLIKNNIIVRGNTEPVAGILWNSIVTPDISYNDVYDPADTTGTGGFYAYHDGAQWNEASGGAGAISENPLFIDETNGYFYLHTDSPCVDAGDPDAVYNDNDGSRNDMGAFGGLRLDIGGLSHIGSGFIFTSVGKIPITEINQTPADDCFGLAQVSPTAAEDFRIPQYTDAPFGGDLWIRGLFGANDDVDFYQIIATPEDISEATFALNDPLTKTKYTILPGGSVAATRVRLGPQTVGTVDNLYQLNKTGFWSQQDLRMIWKTAGLNGRYRLDYRAFKQTGPDQVVEVSLFSNVLDHMTLWIDNSSLDVQINEVLKMDGSSLAECEEIVFTTGGGTDLVFNITAEHPNGFLRYYVLDCYWGHDNFGGRFTYDQYVGSNDGSPPVWTGIDDTLPPLSPKALDGTPMPWVDCAYRFRLAAGGRMTDGYRYLRWNQYSVYHDVRTTGVTPASVGKPCDGCEEESNLAVQSVEPLAPIPVPENLSELQAGQSKSRDASRRILTPLAGHSADDFVDTWINADPNTGRITEIIIGQTNSGEMIVHAYGACYPTDCDWGPVTAAAGDPFTAVYLHGFKTSVLTLELIGADTLHVHDSAVFHDGTGRDYETDDTFIRNTIWVDESNTTGVENGSRDHPYDTIGEGVTAAIRRQRVRVLPGEYNEAVGMKSGVDLIGSGPSFTVINPLGDGYGVSCIGIGSDVLLAGFTIVNAQVGVYCHTSRLSIRENVITNMDLESLSADGIRLDDSSPLIQNNVIYHVGGMGIRGQGNSEPRIINNTIYDYGYYAGISFSALNIGAVSPVIKNNIVVRGNEEPVGGILWSSPCTAIVSYNDVYDPQNVTGGGSYFAYHDGTQWTEVSGGTGALMVDPLFEDAESGYFHLQTDSLCIDAGDPAPEFNDYDGSRNDMGAFGGQRLEIRPSAHAGSGFIFTGIGKTPITEIVHDSADPSHGLLRVSAAEAAAQSIPRFTDAAFGGQLWIRGLFGANDNIDYYQLEAASYVDSITKTLTDPLTKIKFTINSDGSVTSTRVRMGPITVAGVPNLYILNQPDEYWTYTDLRHIWNTNGLNGKYNVSYKAYRAMVDGSVSQVTLPSNELDHFTLRINNQPVQMRIENIAYSDLTSIAECEKIYFPHAGDSSLVFNITAWHPDGFLRYYRLNCYWGNNRYGGEFTYDQYVGSNDGTPPSWTGFINQQLPPLLPRASDGTVMNWHTCPYHFRLEGSARITDGSNYLKWAADNVYQSVQLISTP